MDCPMAPPAPLPAGEVKDAISTTCSVSNMSISSVDVELDADVAQICRDYIRGVCSRKKRCKFQHPSVQELNTPVLCKEEKKYEFCHDHQNKTCERSTCRYIHCTSEEEQSFCKTRQLALKYKCQYELGIYNMAITIPKTNQSTHCQKDHRRGFSENGNESKRFRSTPHHYSQPPPPPTQSDSTNHKRAITPIVYSDHHIQCGYQQLLDESKTIRKENEILRKKIEELQRRVSDLSTMNEMLLEQNAQYRQNCRTTQSMQANGIGQSVNQMTNQLTGSIHQSVPVGVPGVAVAQNVGQYSHAAVQGGGPIYTPSGGVVSMRVVNNSVMTPAVMTTMPSSVPSNPQSAPPIQIQHQMRPPPGLQAVTVQPNDPVQVQLSPSQSANASMVSGGRKFPQGPMPLQYRPGSSGVMVNQVPVVTVQSLGQMQTGTQVRPIMESNSVNQNVQSNQQDIQNQVTVVASYQGARQPQPNQQPHMNGGQLPAPIQYQEMQRIPVHHQQHP